MIHPLISILKKIGSISIFHRCHEKCTKKLEDLYNSCKQFVLFEYIKKILEKCYPDKIYEIN